MGSSPRWAEDGCTCVSAVAVRVLLVRRLFFGFCPSRRECGAWGARDEKREVETRARLVRRKWNKVLSCYIPGMKAYVRYGTLLRRLEKGVEKRGRDVEYHGPVQQSSLIVTPLPTHPPSKLRRAPPSGDGTTTHSHISSCPNHPNKRPRSLRTGPPTSPT